MSTAIGELRARYEQLNDAALLELSSDPDSLNDLAKQVLLLELEARGLTAPETETNSVDPGEERRLITIASYRDSSEAIVARSVLESLGIECYLQNENMIRLDWPTSNALGGIRLQVADVDVEAARAAMRQPAPELIDPDGTAESEQLQCPGCGSREVTYRGRSRGAALVSLMLMSIPLPLGRASWTCDVCGARWDDEKNN